MKILVTILSLVALNLFAAAQDPQELMAEGKKLEQRFKEDEALVKYKAAATLQTSLQKAINKCAELTANIGGRLPAGPDKHAAYLQALKLVEASLKVDSTNAEANMLASVVYGKLTETEPKKEKILEHVQKTYDYAVKATKADATYGKGWHVLGRWHIEMLQLNAIKKAAVKLLSKTIPDPNLEVATGALEKSVTLEPYYCPAYLDLAKAYQLQRKYEKSIATLEKLSKLPTRRQDDVAVKAEGAVLLQKLQ